MNNKQENPQYRKLAKGRAYINGYKDNPKKPDHTGKIIVTETLEPGEYSLSIYNEQWDDGNTSLGVYVQPAKKKQADNHGAEVPF